MKHFILLFSIFLLSCSNAVAGIETNAPSTNISAQNISTVSNENAIIKEVPQTQLIINQSAVMLNKNTIAKKNEHTIEVTDVTEDANACLIKVDSATLIINKGETKSINGIKIFVADIRIMHSQLEDNDACQLIIA